MLRRRLEHAFAPVRRSAIDRPAAAERHEQRRGVRQPGGFRLYAGDGRVEVHLLRVEHRHLVDLPQGQLLLNDIEAGLGGVFRLDRRLHRTCIGLQAAQRVGHILQRRDHRLAIQRIGLVQRRLRRLLLVVERHAVKHGLRRARSNGVERRARREHLREGRGTDARIGRQRDVGEPRGDGDADQRTRRMHGGLRRPHIRTLPHHGARQADRKIRRQADVPVSYTHLDVYKRQVQGVAVRRLRGGRRQLLVIAGVVDADLGQEQAALGQRIEMRHPDRRLRRLQRGIAFDGQANQFVERPRPERRPPARGDIGAGDEMLRRDLRRGRTGPRRCQRLRRIAIDIRCRR